MALLIDCIRGALSFLHSNFNGAGLNILSQEHEDGRVVGNIGDYYA